jgi:hypothetical protein
MSHFIRLRKTFGTIALLSASAGVTGCLAATDPKDPPRDKEIANSALPLDSGSIVTTDDAAALASALLGGGTAVTITSATYSGAASASGTYVDGPMNLKKGSLFTTGAALLSVPPDDGPSTSQSNDLPGDALCDALIPGYTSYDAAKLTVTFDLEAGYDGISLNSVFGSEEFPEWVNTSFNDVYGVYLNGQQVAFDNNGNPITINGPFFASSEVVVAPATETEYDGSTGVLQTKAPLVGGSTGNVLQIVICDAGDHVFDSGVFIANLNGCVGDDCSGTKPCTTIDDDGDGSNACDDCDDTNADVHPGATEICDKADNDCDGTADDGVCQPVCVTIQRGTSGDVADAFIGPGEVWNYGADPYLYTGAWRGFEKRSLLRFDLSSIPSSAEVQSATFTIDEDWVWSSNDVEAHVVLVGWDEATVTWATFGDAAFSDPAIAGTFSSSGPGAHTMGLAGPVQEWVSGAVTNHGIVLAEDVAGQSKFHSSEYSNVAARPKLDVCYIPYVN